MGGPEPPKLEFMSSNSSHLRRQRQRNGTSFKLFLQWWIRELAALVPNRFRPKNRPPSKILWVALETATLVFWRNVGQKRSEVGRVDLALGDGADQRIALDAILSRARGYPLGVCLQAGQVLRKEVVLPLAAVENLSQVIGFELARLTPFSSDQVYSSYRVLQEDRRGNRLLVLLGVVPRHFVDEILAHFAKRDDQPQTVLVCDEVAGSGDCLDFIPPQYKPRPARTDQWLAGAMMGVTLLLVATLLAIPLWQKRSVAMALLPVQAEVQKLADAVGVLKQEQQKLLDEHNFPIEQKLTTPTKVAVLEELTRLLPDATWLQQMQVTGAEVTIQGNTGSSAALIGLLGKSELLENASFKSPLVKVQGNEDRFQLAATIKTIGIDQALAAQPVSVDTPSTRTQKSENKKAAPRQ